MIHPDLVEKLNDLSFEEEIPVIVTLTDQVDFKQFKDKNKKLRRSKINRALRNKAEKTQKPLKEFLQKKNARKIKSFWVFNGLAVTLRADQVGELADLPEVLNVRLDAVHTLPPPSPSQPGTPGWNLDAIHAPPFWELGYTGTGVVIASMDTGVDYNHPDIGPRWRGGTNSWFDPHDEHPATPFDTSGHGTQVMGVMVGGDASGAPIGIAPDAQWIAVKIYRDDGFTSDSIIHAGFQWLLDPDGKDTTDDAPDVVNNSWGFDELVDVCYSDPNSIYHPDILALQAAGIAVVFSAGNTGPNPASSISPANYPESFAGGSVDETLQVAGHSSRGPSACDATVFPEIVAPGVNVRTTDLYFGSVPDSYTSVSGTSIAASHVSGAMALLLSADPQLTVSELEDLLVQSASDLGVPGPDNDYGNGLLDVVAAAQSLDIYPLTVEITGKGSVTSDPPGIDCPGDCEKLSVAGTNVTLTAVPGPTSTFTGWSGDCTGDELVCEVPVEQSKNVTAGFYSFPWKLFVPVITR